MPSVQNKPPKYMRYVKNANIDNLRLSQIESEELEERELKCPYCKFIICSVFNNTGHIRLKCSKCKAIMIMNVAYFRRTNQRYNRKVFYKKARYKR